MRKEFVEKLLAKCSPNKRIALVYDNAYVDSTMKRALYDKGVIAVKVSEYKDAIQRCAGLEVNYIYAYNVNNINCDVIQLLRTRLRGVDKPLKLLFYYY